MRALGEVRHGNVLKKTQGFSLVEMAIVLVIIGLLLGGMLMPLSAQMEQRRVAETQKALDEINQALIGFAVVNGFLPCPDTDNNGQQNRAGAACTNQEGILPWVDLGVAETDSWGNRFRYRVTAAFSDNATLFTLVSAGDITVLNAAAGANVATVLPALILSHGPNGLGATNQAGGANAPATGADELANTDGNATFVSHTPTGVGALPNGEFDDLVAWVSPNILFNRMVTAGRLPP